MLLNAGSRAAPWSTPWSEFSVGSNSCQATPNRAPATRRMRANASALRGHQGPRTATTCRRDNASHSLTGAMQTAVAAVPAARAAGHAARAVTPVL